MRSSIRRTAVVTEAPIEAAWAVKAWSFWRLTWPRHSHAVVPAIGMKTASSSQAVHVLALVLIAFRRGFGTDPGSRPTFDRA